MCAAAARSSDAFRVVRSCAATARPSTCRAIMESTICTWRAYSVSEDGPFQSTSTFRSWPAAIAPACTDTQNRCDVALGTTAMVLRWVERHPPRAGTSASRRAAGHAAKRFVIDRIRFLSLAFLVAHGGHHRIPHLRRLEPRLHGRRFPPAFLRKIANQLAAVQMSRLLEGRHRIVVLAHQHAGYSQVVPRLQRGLG